VLVSCFGLLVCTVFMFPGTCSPIVISSLCFVLVYNPVCIVGVLSSVPYVPIAAKLFVVFLYLFCVRIMLYFVSKFALFKNIIKP